MGFEGFVTRAHLQCTPGALSPNSDALLSVFERKYASGLRSSLLVERQVSMVSYNVMPTLMRATSFGRYEQATKVSDTQTAN